MRKLAELVAREHPDILAVCDIKPGDALSLATRFDLQWAYRGRQALFWGTEFSAAGVQGDYLPLSPPQLFGRRGFLRVDGELGGKRCRIFSTHFARDRAARIAELRFARAELRDAHHAAILFAHLHERRIGFADLGFTDASPPDSGDERVYARGFDLKRLTVRAATV